jgi:hypothetical protein
VLDWYGVFPSPTKAACQVVRKPSAVVFTREDSIDCGVEVRLAQEYTEVTMQES